MKLISTNNKDKINKIITDDNNNTIENIIPLHKLDIYLHK